MFAYIIVIKYEIASFLDCFQIPNCQLLDGVKLTIHWRSEYKAFRFIPLLCKELPQMPSRTLAENFLFQSVILPHLYFKLEKKGETFNKQTRLSLRPTLHGPRFSIPKKKNISITYVPLYLRCTGTYLWYVEETDVVVHKDHGYGGHI
jgi:hypothetical protein